MATMIDLFTYHLLLTNNTFAFIQKQNTSEQNAAANPSNLNRALLQASKKTWGASNAGASGTAGCDDRAIPAKQTQYHKASALSRAISPPPGIKLLLRLLLPDNASGICRQP
jgi:hypothetical protein